MIRVRVREGIPILFPIKQEGGFGLIEAMISLALLAIGLLAIASGEIQALTLNKRARETAKATAVAQNMIELVRRNRQAIDEYETFSFNEGRGTGTAVNATSVADFQYFRDSFVELCGGASATSTCKWSASIGVVDSPVINNARVVNINITSPHKSQGITVATTIGN